VSGERLLVRLGTTLAILALVATGGGCRTAGDPYTDARIEAEIKASLVAQRDANLTRVGVVSNDGTVYLSGAVSSAAQKARAESVARTVGGVRKIVNALDVRPGRE
jgi:hyperosmotically inducible protein